MVEAPGAEWADAVTIRMVKNDEHRLAANGLNMTRDNQIKLVFAIAFATWSTSTVAALGQGQLRVLLGLWRYLFTNPFFCGLCWIPVGLVLGLLGARQRKVMLIAFLSMEMLLLQRNLAWGWLPALLRAGVGAGLLGYATLLVGWIRHRESRWALALGHALALLWLFAVQQQVFFVNWRTHSDSATYDLFFYAADVQLGPPLCCLVPAWFNSDPRLYQCGLLVYSILGQMMAVCAVVWFFRPTGSNPNLYFFAAGALGLVGYFSFSGIGPALTFAEVFPSAPVQVPTPEVIFPPGKIPRNTMPSMHVMWAYSVWFSLKNQGNHLARLGLAYLVLMPWCSFLGSHYLVDYLVSLAMAPAIHSGVDGFTRVGPACSRRLVGAMAVSALLGLGLCPLIIQGVAVWRVWPWLLMAWCWLCLLLCLVLSIRLQQAVK